MKATLNVELALDNGVNVKLVPDDISTPERTSCDKCFLDRNGINCLSFPCTITENGETIFRGHYEKIGPTLEAVIVAEHHMAQVKAQKALDDLNDKRFKLCLKIEALLKDYGFADAKMDEEDSGRRDVIATFLGHKFHVGVDSLGGVMLLAPLANESRSWQIISRDLSDLQSVVKRELANSLRQGLKPKGKTS